MIFSFGIAWLFFEAPFAMVGTFPIHCVLAQKRRLPSSHVYPELLVQSRPAMQRGQVGKIASHANGVATDVAIGGPVRMGAIFARQLRTKVAVLCGWEGFGVWQNAIGQQHEAMHGSGRRGPTQNLEVQSSRAHHQAHHALRKVREGSRIPAPIALVEQHAIVASSLLGTADRAHRFKGEDQGLAHR